MLDKVTLHLNHKSKVYGAFSSHELYRVYDAGPIFYTDRHSAGDVIEITLVSLIPSKCSGTHFTLGAT